MPEITTTIMQNQIQALKQRLESKYRSYKDVSNIDISGIVDEAYELGWGHMVSVHLQQKEGRK